MRQIDSNGKVKTGHIASEYYPYHKVSHEFDLKKVKKDFAKRIFAGKYKVLTHDTLTCDSIVTLGRDFSVKGINGIGLYNFDIELNIDNMVPNIFSLKSSKNQVIDESNYMPFKFDGDTLFLNKYKIVYDNNGDPDRVVMVSPHFKLLKLN